MDQEQRGIIPEVTDPVLKGEQGRSLVTESLIIDDVPTSFVKIKKNTIKVVSMYLQLLWDENANGKTIHVQDLISNAQTLFGTKFESKDFFRLRHIAADLREVHIFMGFQSSLEKCYKNIDVKRMDIGLRIDLSNKICEFFSKIVHLNFRSSHNVAKEIANLVKQLDNEEIKIPDQFEKYYEAKIFDDIFEKICIIFILNFHKIFSEFLYDKMV